MTDDEPSTDLAAIEAAARRLGRDVLPGSLRAGLPAEDVRASLASVGLRSTTALESLYGWHDGSVVAAGATLDDHHLVPGFFLLPIREAVSTYASSSPDRRWPTALLPILANGGGDFYGVDLSAPHSAPVRHVRIEQVEHPVEFASLDAFLATLAAAYESGVFFVDAHGYLEVDDTVFGDLAGELDPDVPWWRE